MIAAFPILALLAAAPVDAHRVEAKVAFDRAERAFKAERYQEALPEYERAYSLSSLPEILFNIGQCHRNLENFDRAGLFFRRYLAEASEVPDRPRVEALAAEMEHRAKPQLTPSVAALPAAHEVQPVLQPPPTVVEDQPSPFYTRWWFWTLIGAAVAAGGAAAVLATSNGAEPPSASIARFDYSK